MLEEKRALAADMGISIDNSLLHQFVKPCGRDLQIRPCLLGIKNSRGERSQIPGYRNEY
jgi:hypothetical protein